MKAYTFAVQAPEGFQVSVWSTHRLAERARQDYAYENWGFSLPDDEARPMEPSEFADKYFDYMSENGNGIDSEYCMIEEVEVDEGVPYRAGEGEKTGPVDKAIAHAIAHGAGSGTKVSIKVAISGQEEMIWLSLEKDSKTGEPLLLRAGFPTFINQERVDFAVAIFHRENET